MSSRTYLSAFKTVSLTLIFKKPGLDASLLSNHRPISNLPLICKILERAVANQLQQHMTDHLLFDPLYFRFLIHHSTETALLKITNDLLIASDSGYISILIVLDLSAAFDTISHSFLLTWLSNHLGITDSALLFFPSYLSGSSQFVTHGGEYPDRVNHGVPQGPMLGPLQFNIYMFLLGDISPHHGLHFHSYADDTQLYISTKPSANLAPQSLINCSSDTET